MNKNKLIYILSFVVVLITTLSCQKERMPEGIKPFDTSLGLAIVNSEITSGSIGDNFTVIQTGADGLMEMLIRPNMFYFPYAEKIISFPSDLFNSSLPGVQVVVTTTSQFSISTPLPAISMSFGGSSFTSPGTDLRKVFLKEGEISLTFQHTLSNRNIDNFVISFDNILKSDGSGGVLTLDGINGSSLTSNEIRVSTKALNGYYLDLPNTSKEIKPRISLRVAGGSVLSNGNIEISSLKITGAKWSKIEAKMGDVSFPMIDNGEKVVDLFALTPFKSNVSNNDTNRTTPSKPKELDFFFNNAKIKFDIFNGFGMKLNLAVDPLLTKRKDGSTLQTFTGNNVDIDPALDKAIINGNNLAGYNSQSTQDTLENSLVNNILKYGPTKLGYGIVLNSVASNNNVSNFIYDTSRVAVKPEVKIPFNGYFKLYDIEHYFDYPIKKDDTTSTFSAGGFEFEVKQGIFKANIINSLPLTFNINAYFVREDSSFIVSGSDTLKLGPMQVNGATTDANGKVISSVTFEKTFFLDQAKFKKINNECKKIVLVGNPETSEYLTAPKKIVKIYPSDKMNVKIYFAGDISVRQK